MKRAPIRALRRGPDTGPEADDDGLHYDEDGLLTGSFTTHHPQVPHADLPDEVAELRAELDRARQREVAARQRAELLEANLHDARTNLLDLRHTIEDLRRALPPGPTPSSAAVTPTPRRRWWSNK